MKFSETLCILVLFIVCAGSLFAQQHIVNTPSPKYNNFLYQDTAGFIWAGTLNGWYRTDGNTYRHFGVEEGNKEGYDSYVQSDLFTDRVGGLWYTGHNALHHIDEGSGEITSYRVPMKDDSVVNGYRAFYLDTLNQQLWLLVDDQIRTFDVNERTFKDTGITGASYEFAVRAGADGEPDLIIGCPWHSGPGFIVNRRKSTEDPWEQEDIRFPGTLENHIVTRAVFLQHDQVLMGTSGGLAIQDLTKDKLSMLSIDYDVNLPTGDINDILLDWTGKKLYVTEKGKYIWTFPLDENGVVNWSVGQVNMQVEKPTALNQDKGGGIWVSSSEGGIHRVDTVASQFTLSSVGEPLVDLRIGIDKTAYGLSKTGSIYSFGFAKEPISLSNPQKQNFTALRYSWEEWIGWKGGLLRQSIRGDRKTTFQPLSIGNPVFIAVHEAGEVLAAGPSGIFSFDGKDGDVFRGPNWLQQVEGFDIDFLHYEPGHQLVMGYGTSELWYFNWRTDSLILERRLPLGYEPISYAYGNQNRTDWIGTSEGLFRISADLIEEVLLDRRHPIRPNIRTIIPVGDSILILGTDRGLLHYNLRTHNTRYFTEADGLPSTNFRAGAGGLDRNGRCWMLVGGQAISFDPNDLARSTPVLPKPYVDQVWVNDLPLPQATRKISGPGLSLPYWKNDLRFSIRNIGFDAPERTSSAMRLIGRDSTWREVDQGTPVAFSNLAPGDYRLEIQSRNKNGIYSSPKAYKISINRPWYDLFYVQLLILLGFTLFGYGVNRLITRNRIRRLEQKHEKQEAISTERMRIARRLHDDLGADLTSIMSVISTHRYLQGQNGGDETLNLEELQGLVKDASANMREIVWAIDDQKCAFHHLVEQLTQLVRTRSVVGWKPVLEFPPVNPEYLFSAEQKLNIYLILKEGLQNIEKHAPSATVVSLKLRITEASPAYLDFQLSDNGPGLKTGREKNDATEISGFGLDNMRHRAATIGAKLTIAETLPHGTCLTLLLPVKELTVGTQ